MKILAMDTTAKVSTAAITDGKQLIALDILDSDTKHSVSLLPMAESMLCYSKLDISDIEAFAVSTGPGSFTGVRIGVSLVKGLAFGSNKPCIGVSSLHALALNLNGFKGIICPVMDARRSQLYNALFESDGVCLKRLCDDRLITLEALDSELEAYSQYESIYLVGDGYDIASRQLHSKNIAETPELLRVQNAYSVALAALQIYNENSQASCYSDALLSPVYLRASQAERERQSQNL